MGLDPQFQGGGIPIEMLRGLPSAEEMKENEQKQIRMAAVQLAIQHHGAGEAAGRSSNAALIDTARSIAVYISSGK